MTIKQSITRLDDMVAQGVGGSVPLGQAEADEPVAGFDGQLEGLLAADEWGQH